MKIPTETKLNLTGKSEPESLWGRVGQFQKMAHRALLGEPDGGTIDSLCSWYK